MANQKWDSGKAPLWQGTMKYFSRALRSVAQVSQMGHDKYGSWGGWVKVDKAEQRYADALLRHLSFRASGEEIDPESGLPHLAHAAWNALAILELELSASRPSLEERQAVPAPLPPTPPSPEATGALCRDRLWEKELRRVAQELPLTQPEGLKSPY